MNELNYLKLKASLFSDLDDLKKRKKLSRQEYTLLTLKVHSGVEEVLLQVQEEVTKIKENRT